MSNNIITKNNFKSLDGLQVVSKLVVNNGSDESFAILANQINWGDNTYTTGTYTGKSYTSILGVHLDGPYTYNMFDALGEAINNKINDRINADGSINFPTIEISNIGKGPNTYLAELSLDETNKYKHKLKAQYAGLPTPPPITITYSEPIGAGTGKYISGISAVGHEITYTYSDLPSLSMGSASGLSSSKFISSISVSGHTISYTYSNLPSVKHGVTSFLEDGTGYYLSGLKISHNEDNSYSISYTYEAIPELSASYYDAYTFKLDFSNNPGDYPWYDKSIMEGKYVSYVGIIPDGSKHKITTVINDLPTAKDLWGNYSPKLPYSVFYDENGNVFPSSSVQTQQLNSTREVKITVYNADKANSFEFGCYTQSPFVSAELTPGETIIDSANNTCTYTYTVNFNHDGQVRLQTSIEYLGGGISSNMINFNVPALTTNSFSVNPQSFELSIYDKYSPTRFPSTTAYSKEVTIYGNMDSIEIANKDKINSYFITSLSKIVNGVCKLTVQSDQYERYNIDVVINLLAHYSNGSTEKRDITVRIVGYYDGTLPPGESPDESAPSAQALSDEDPEPTPTDSSTLPPSSYTSSDEATTEE